MAKEKLPQRHMPDILYASETASKQAKSKVAAGGKINQPSSALCVAHQ